MTEINFKKYTETSKVLFKAQLAYRFDTFLSMVFTVSKILLAYVLWGAIFGRKDMVAGFTFNSMLSYYIISSFVTQLDQSSGTGRQIADEIRSGRFSKYMIKPMSIFGYFAAQTAGVSAFLLLFNLLAAVLWVLVFRIGIAFTGNAVLIAYAVALILLGLLFMLQLNYYIGILAFKYLDIGIFMMIKDNLLQFITGSFIPLAILPEGIVKAMGFFPFYYVSYLPSMLLMGRNGGEALKGIICLVCWNVFFGLLISITYRKYKTKFDGVGI